MRIRTFILFILMLCSQHIMAENFPVAYKGRFRPFDVYAKLWLYDFYHAPKIKSKDQQKFKDHDAESLLWKLTFEGHKDSDEAPLFWIQQAEIKRSLGLELTQDRFSYKELHHLVNLPPTLLAQVQTFASYNEDPDQKNFIERAQNLINLKTPPKELAFQLEQEFPLNERLMKASHLLHTLPGKGTQINWYPLKALGLKVYDPLSNTLKNIENFTIYSDTTFDALQKAYLEKDKSLNNLLASAYTSIAGKTYLKAYTKSLAYPSLLQLQTESFYYKAPLLEIAILLYTFSIAASILSYTLKSNRLKYMSITVLFAAFAVHTFILAIRCFILERPPVSNMFETVIYVPWIALISSFGFWLYFKKTLFLLASSISALGLLILIQLTNLNSNMENVQAVLDSQYWLIVHVLLVVGSYGLFILAGILGQFYLGLYCFNKQKYFDMNFLAQSILQTMYLGVALLIPGTILGGVWAAESWGRFWDWDPKESWAFISSCVYLIWIHAYIFNKIGPFGLAVGSVIGLMTISFTWYGVNYILGTGLHSYGFGSGGEAYYYLFLALQIFFIAWSSMSFIKDKKKIESQNKIVL